MYNALLGIEPEIQFIHEKKLVGKQITMSLENNRTSELWRSFFPNLKEVQNRVGNDLYSIQVYNQSYFDGFSQRNEFEKWAAAEVFDFHNIPFELEIFTIPNGLYAIFHYKGLSTDNTLFQFIYNTWLPNSTYQLDNRPHFEVLGEKYKNSDPNSEEDIFIPIRPKNIVGIE